MRRNSRPKKKVYDEDGNEVKKKVIRFGDDDWKPYTFTPQQLLTQLKAKLREAWAYTNRRAFLDSVRIKREDVPQNHQDRGTWKSFVQCVECDYYMGLSEKEHYVLKSTGKLSKVASLVYAIDHIDGIPSFTSLDDLEAYAKALLEGEQQILCSGCHDLKTHENHKRKEG